MKVRKLYARFKNNIFAADSTETGFITVALWKNG